MIRKIRAWHKEEKVMFNVHRIDFDDKLNVISVGTEDFDEDWNSQNNIHLCMSINIKEIIPLQSTGLLDKNGVETWEGDLIKTTFFMVGVEAYHEIKEVVRKGSCFGVYGKNQYDFIPLNDLFKGVESSEEYIPNIGDIYKEHKPVFEVIGNKFVNPELLKERS